MRGEVTAVARSAVHNFSKTCEPRIRLLAGLGVEGDAHLGKTHQHLYKIRQDPTLPNLCQVHFMAAELFEDLAAKGFDVGAGQLGENVTTRGLDLMTLPTGTLFYIGSEAVVEISGMRNPCYQIDQFKRGLKNAVRDEAPDGTIIRKSGIMGIVLEGGEIRAGDEIRVELPPKPHKALECV